MSVFYYLDNKDNFEYRRARQAFTTGGDEKAFQIAQKLYKKNPTIDKYREFYLETIKRFDFNYTAQIALLEFTNDDILDINTINAKQYLADMRQELLETYSPNYIELVPYNSKVMRWSEVPIKVTIEDKKDLNLYYTNEIQRAFLEWQKVTNGRIKFEFTNKNPDITVKFDEMNKEEKEKNKYNLYIVANTEPEFDDNILHSMNITFFTKNDKDEPFTPEEIYNTALHEVAHALGICGHSKDKDDILHFSTTYHEDKTFKELSEKDVNTMKLLYDIKPHITKGKGEYKIHPQIVLGTENDINNNKLTEAKNYIKHAPKLPNGYIDLAQNSMFAKDYESAKDALKKAIKYANDDNTKFIIYYDYAVICYETGDMNKALFYADKAQEFRDKNSVTALKANIYYKKREISKAIENYELLVKNHPENIMYSVNLAKLYINQWNYVKASRTLHKLIANNPEAKQDKRVKNFNILMTIIK